MNTTQHTRRNLFLVAAQSAAAVALSVAAISPAMAQSAGQTITRQIYDSFQRGQLDRWDTLLAEDVVINSPARFGTKGRAAAKGWANEFLTAFAPRIDLVDEINAVDNAGNGRAVMTFNLNWKHVKPFFGVQPTGRVGTSVENLIMTVRNGKVTRMEVADTTLDLALYLHERGWVYPQNISPEPIIKGIERPVDQEPISLK
jgi:ketosteroid isomerase-like protein